MGKDSNENKWVFPLTSLQIGDLQSYLSHLSLFLAPKSKKFYILVDNRPWLKKLVSRPTHLWQLMVTKSRLSPFAISKARKERKESDEMFGLGVESKSDAIRSKKDQKWFSFVDAATMSRKRALLPVEKLRNSLLLSRELHRTLYGFIVFEVAWDCVRGINYLNELQTDTSFVTEAKFMKRWEFDSIAQAASCMSSWFSGTDDEQLFLKDHLESTVGEVFYDAKEDFSRTVTVNDDDNDGHTCGDWVHVDNDSLQSPCKSLNVDSESEETGTIELESPPFQKGRNLETSSTTENDIHLFSEERQSRLLDSFEKSETLYTSNYEDTAEFTLYKDVLILCRFNDRDLPFKLREIIMSDLRLLTLLESGLPSWVIFLQSYPGFCHLYRPWMCPLVRALYVLISIITVLIGFYDLYKNVPVLKDTFSRIFGPLFDWIENWEMISRIRYLGTMLFLHNFQKAIKWFLMVTRSARSFFVVVTQPLGQLVEHLGFLLPVWNVGFEVVESCFSLICIMIGSSFGLIWNLLQLIFFPLWFILSFTSRLATSIIYPTVWVIWEVLYAPIRVVTVIASIMAFILTSTYELFGDIWMSVASIFRLSSASAATVNTYEVPIWRSLWNDIFSQVFRAVRSILNGFVAFFTACNRHRLSIYNHSKGFIQRLCQQSRHANSGRSRRTSRAANMHFEVGRRFHVN